MSDAVFDRRGLLSLRALGAALGVTSVPAGVRRRPLPLPVSAGGRAAILRHDCRRGCSTCVERCPVPGALRLEAGRPVVDAGRCTGCGVCRDVCPAHAVVIVPGGPA